MCRELRRHLRTQIDLLSLKHDDVQREFRRRGLFDFFRLDGWVDADTVEDLLHFVRYFAFDGGDGAYNGFAWPWHVAIAVCQDNTSPVRLSISLEQFRDESRGLVGTSATWELWEAFLLQAVEPRPR